MQRRVRAGWLAEERRTRFAGHISLGVDPRKVFPEHAAKDWLGEDAELTDTSNVQSSKIFTPSRLAAAVTVRWILERHWLPNHLSKT